MNNVKKFLTELLGSERNMRRIWDRAHSKMIDGKAASAQYAFTEAMLEFYESQIENSKKKDSEGGKNG